MILHQQDILYTLMMLIYGDNNDTAVLQANSNEDYMYDGTHL